eukprot:jgi/Botrbrau1/3882/Bobra.0183s0103.2
MGRQLERLASSPHPVSACLHPTVESKPKWVYDKARSMAVRRSMAENWTGRGVKCCTIKQTGVVKLAGWWSVKLAVDSSVVWQW